MNENTTLYFRAGSSDKVYQASLEEEPNGHVVNFAFGRRGTTLQTGTKTATPLPYEKAKAIYDKLVQEKTAKGYTAGADGTPYSRTANEQRATGILPQLLNPVTEAEVSDLLDNDSFVMQEKFDGRRLLICKGKGNFIGINRKGLTVALPKTIETSAQSSPDDFIFDGEIVGEVYHAFDLLALNGSDYRQQKYADRLYQLEGLLAASKGTAIRVVQTATTDSEKHMLFDRLKAHKAEGVVFKRLDAPYVAGRPNSGGAQLKFKFCATASCIVAKVNDSKRSVALTVLDGRKKVAIGSVTIPPNTTIPAVGAIVEVKYLYAYLGGSLFQPIYQGIRDDISQDACVIGQLEYKADDEDA